MIQFHLRIFFKWVVKNHQLGTMLGGSGFAIIGDECFPHILQHHKNPGAQLTIIVSPKKPMMLEATLAKKMCWQLPKFCLTDCVTVGKQIITILIRGPFINLHDPTGKLSWPNPRYTYHIYLKVKIAGTDTNR